jgi:hypothetical protein
MHKTQFYYPSEIELVTGFGKGQLRKWRQRFGFPPKESNPSGEAAYSLMTVNQLLLIKRLLEAGFKPAQIVGKSTFELEKLKLGIGLNIQAAIPDESTIKFIDYIKLANLKGFVDFLAEKRCEQTMFDFVQSTITPLMISIGDAWTRDEIDIHHEHLCTAYVERYLQSEILNLLPRKGLPVIFSPSIKSSKMNLQGLNFIPTSICFITFCDLMLEYLLNFVSFIHQVKDHIHQKKFHLMKKM